MIGAKQYACAIPQSAVINVYNGEYPYWGYGLGVGDEFDQLARNEQWDEILNRLDDLQKQYGDQLDQLQQIQNRTDAQNTEINELKTRLERVQLHIAGLNKRPENFSVSSNTAVQAE
jgi:hypothetical protein